MRPKIKAVGAVSVDGFLRHVCLCPTQWHSYKSSTLSEICRQPSSFRRLLDCPQRFGKVLCQPHLVTPSARRTGVDGSLRKVFDRKRIRVDGDADAVHQGLFLETFRPRAFVQIRPPFGDETRFHSQLLCSPRLITTEMANERRSGDHIAHVVHGVPTPVQGLPATVKNSFQGVLIDELAEGWVVDGKLASGGKNLFSSYRLQIVHHHARIEVRRAIRHRQSVSVFHFDRQGQIVRGDYGCNCRLHSHERRNVRQRRDVAVHVNGMVEIGQNLVKEQPVIGCAAERISGRKGAFVEQGRSFDKMKSADRTDGPMPCDSSLTSSEMTVIGNGSEA